MECIIANKEWMEVDYIEKKALVDVDIGDTNDFSLTMEKSYVRQKGISKRYAFFVPGTEFGGLLEDAESETSGNYVTYMGKVWRELLNQLIIEPPEGKTHLKISGDAHQVMRLILASGTGLLFTIPEEDSGIDIDCEFRYVSALTGLSKALDKQGARIDIKAEQGGSNEPFKVMLRAVKKKDYSEELEYDGDNHINVKIRDCKSGINHLICLGTGEMQERTVIHLYVQLDGSISKKQYYTGIDERTAVYEYSSVSSDEELVNEGTEYLKEIMNYKEADMDVHDIDLDIGDVVSARDREMGIALSRPIINKILRNTEEGISIEYKVKGEE